RQFLAERVRGRRRCPHVQSTVSGLRRLFQAAQFRAGGPCWPRLCACSSRSSFIYPGKLVNSTPLPARPSMFALHLPVPALLLPFVAKPWWPRCRPARPVQKLPGSCLVRLRRFFPGGRAFLHSARPRRGVSETLVSQRVRQSTQSASHLARRA